MPANRASPFPFYRDDMWGWAFFTNASSFKERYALVKERGLQGFCSSVLGTEDPAIWNLLPSHKQVGNIA